ncbi:MAG TPA: DUF2911 domain-containing protein [Candidatus Eisenbacteria bacterium]|nr:DUF2911 domain-containing protein [Candidatus Eisenbacteria bacterium]
MKLHAAARPLLSVLAAMVLTSPAVRAELTLPRPSPNASVTQVIGTTKLELTYSRPGVKGRAIWGALVPYGSPWRTGANEPTTFITPDDITVSGQKLAAGKYSLVTIPTEGEWTVIFSGQKDLQGTTNYDAKNDVLRVTATPAKGQPDQEWLSLGFDDLTANSCNLVLRWEKLRLAVPIAADVNASVLAAARKEVDNADRDAWRTPFRAASYAFDNGVALDEGSKWLEKSLAMQKNHSNLALKAKWLAKDGKKKDAIVVAKQAIAAGKAATPAADVTATEKLVAEWTGTK